MFWIGKTGSHRISHVQSILAREERRERTTITPASLHHHSHQLLSGDFNACVWLSRMQGGHKLMWSVNIKLPALYLFGGITHFLWLSRLSEALRWDAARPWQVGPHRCCAKRVSTAGYWGLALWLGISRLQLHFGVFERGLGKLDKRLWGIEWGTKSVELEQKVAKRPAVSPGTFTISCDYAIEFRDLGKVVWFSFHIHQVQTHMPQKCI